MTSTTLREIRPGKSPRPEQSPLSGCWLSVILPTLNEARVIGQTLDSVIQGAGQQAMQLIVADGGSVDETREIARAKGALVKHSEPGRSRQMNAGAEAACGNVLLFLHADTHLPNDYPILIRQILEQTEIICGAFDLGIDAKGWKMRVIEWAVNQRCRWLSMPYGDQALFMRSTTFTRLGGYPDIPVLEDYELIRRVKRLGPIGIVGTRVKTSARRWRRQRVMCATLTNQMCIIGYHLGVSPRRLAAWRDDRCVSRTANNGQIHDAGSDHWSGRADRAGVAGSVGK